MAAEKKRGSNGGNARAEKLTKEQRSAIATAAAQRRWAKKNGTDVEKLVVKITDPPFTLSGSTVQPAIIYEPVAAPIIHEPPKEFHCPACIGGNPLEHGLHIAGTIEHPFTPVPAQIVDSPPVFVEPAPAPPQKPVRRVPRVIPKEFKGASQYAEKRLPLAIKEKSEHVGAVAKLDAEINDLVRVIKALGGSVDPQFQQPLYPQQPYYPNPGAPPQYQMPQGQGPVDPGIDPALFQANMGPIPGVNPDVPKVPVIPNTSLGGAMDLDYVPRDEEDRPKLPNMGGGWV